MNRVKSFLLFLAVCISFLLTACGGNSSDSSSTTTTVSGFVEDGPISGATVSLYNPDTGETASICGISGTVSCITTTDEFGEFSLTVPLGTDISNLQLKCSGGQDTDTGFDFTGIEMRTDLQLVQDTAKDIAITPVTTLVTARIEAGDGVEDAQNQVRGWLGLAEDADVETRPSQDLAFQRLTMLLTVMAINKMEEDSGDPLGDIGGSIDSTDLIDDTGAIDTTVIDSLYSDEETRTYICDLHETIKSAEESDLFQATKLTELSQALSTVLATMLPGGETIVEENTSYQANLQTLAEKILEAAGETLIPLGGIIPKWIASYVLYTYDLATWAKMSASAETFTTYLSTAEGALEADPQIAALAATQSRYSVAVPLEESLSGTNQSRIGYYYDSDISHLYKAERLMSVVKDDILNDAVMIEIVQGKARAGLLDEAVNLIETRIYRSESKGDAYRYYGNILIDFERDDEAEEALDQAKVYYEKVITAKGEAFVEATDIGNLQSLASSYRKAQALAKAGEVLDYLENIASYLTTTTTYGRLLISTRDLVDDYMEIGDVDAAIPLIESLYNFAQGTPPNISSGYQYYKAKIYYLVETAKRYADLTETRPEYTQTVVDIYDLVQSIRYDDGLADLTENETWYYIPALAEAMYRVGETETALSLADSIPDTWINYKGKTMTEFVCSLYQTKAFKVVATYEAINSDLNSAKAVIDEHLASGRDKIEAYTYFNSYVKYVAAKLIEEERYAEAAQALGLATAHVDELVETTERNIHRYIIERGHVKIAGLYHEAEEDQAAQDALASAEGILEQLTPEGYLIDALVDIALGYHNLGQETAALNLLVQAVSETDGVADALDPDDCADLYKLIIDAYLEMGKNAAAKNILPAYVSVVRNIFDETVSYSDADHDDWAEMETEYLMKAAELYVSIGENETAEALLDEAKQIADQIYVEATKIKMYTYENGDDLVEMYAQADDFDKALELAQSIPYVNDRNQAIQSIANVYCEMDDFPNDTIANVDTDLDGKPNFFSPLATMSQIDASGLSLDSDSDGDGSPDSEDLRPLYAD